MSRIKLIGWTALAVAVLGYAGGIGFLALGGLDYLDKTQAVTGGIVLGLIGEVGMWVAAGCLGLTIFKKRKALMDRLFRRRSETPTQV